MGGHSWQAAPLLQRGTVLNQGNAFNQGIDDASRLTFVDPLHGWLEVSTALGLGNELIDIFSTNDGGQTWSRIASSCLHSLSEEGNKTGISFKDSQTGWATSYTALTDRAWLYVTHDGGKTWQPITYAIS